MSGAYRFRVRGIPVPKGSMRAFVVKGRARVTANSRSVAEWERLVRFQVQDFRGPPLEGPVEVNLAFYLPRPKSAPRRVTLPAKKPDLDKLARSVLDALVAGQVIRDDAQVVVLRASKRFAGEFAGVEGEVVPA